MSGGRTVLYCGFVAIVRLSLIVNLYMTANIFPGFSAGSGKSILWYAAYPTIPVIVH